MSKGKEAGMPRHFQEEWGVVFSWVTACVKGSNWGGEPGWRGLITGDLKRQAEEVELSGNGWLNLSK